MKHEKEITFSDTIISGMTCDLCGKISSRGTNWASKADSKSKVIATYIKYSEGNDWPDDGYVPTEEIEFDLCPECFKNKLIPWLKNQALKR